MAVRSRRLAPARCLVPLFGPSEANECDVMLRPSNITAGYIPCHVSWGVWRMMKILKNACVICLEMLNVHWGTILNKRFAWAFFKYTLRHLYSTAVQGSQALETPKNTLTNFHWPMETHGNLRWWTPTAKNLTQFKFMAPLIGATFIYTIHFKINKQGALSTMPMRCEWQKSQYRSIESVHKQR